MPINIGIVGLPNVGKSTLFNALSAAGAESANFPFCTIEPNVGVVPVPDSRLDALAKIYGSKRILPTSLEFVDIAGLVRGASKGEGLGNQFLGHIRAVDALAQVVRCFEDDDILHVEGSVDPVRDIETVDTELVLKDIETVTKRQDRHQKLSRAQGKAGDAARSELALLEGLHAHLNLGKPARTAELGEGGEALIGELCLLSAKPMMLIGNVAEEEAATPEQNASYQRLVTYGAEHGMPVMAISAAIEAELSELADAERTSYLESMGLHEPGLHKVIAAGYQLLGLVTFLTAGPQETRAWTVGQNIKAPQAAGTIHSDIERGFIRAEIMDAKDLIALGSEAAVKQAGKFRVEGKEYVVADGDVVHFRFNV